MVVDAVAFVDDGSTSSLIVSPDNGMLLSVTVTDGAIGVAGVGRAEMSFDPEPDGRLVVFRDLLWRRVVTRVEVEMSIRD